jgi:hypothetical protein
MAHHHSFHEAQVPVGVEFRHETLYRSDGNGDNWCQTWAADDTVITSMDDGNWLSGERAYNNHLYRIVGGPDGFARQDLPGYPQFVFNEGGWFGYGIVSVDGALYSFVSKCPENRWSGPFRGFKLLRSADNGATWYRVDRHGVGRLLGPWDAARYEVSDGEMFMLEEAGREGHGGVAYPYSFCEIAQHGRDQSLARDGYLYIYSPEGARTHELLLARAPRDGIGRRALWQYFAGWQGGAPIWSGDIEARQPVHIFCEANAAGEMFGWYSWLPSVVWNPGLGLYIMVNGGTYAGHGLTGSAEDYYHAWMHTKSGSLGFWHAPDPWGPWTPFWYTDEWTVDSPDNRTYQPKLSPKWMSADGREMVLIWSDAMKNAEGRSHTVNYRWNQMRIVIQMAAAD